MIYSRILGTGSYLPARILTNADLEKLVDTNDQWIVERTGIRERHIAAEGEFTSDLATQAARAALEVAGLAADDIDLLLVATTTPDLVFPSTACIVQSKLGMTNGKPAFDLQAVCSGFVYALSVADQFIKTGAAKTGAGDRRRNPFAHHRLERPRQLHPVGRRRGRGGAGRIQRTRHYRHPHPCRRPPQGIAAHHQRGPRPA